MTEFDPEGTESKSFPCPSLVNRDSARRWAGRLGVESEVGELYSDSRSVRTREAVPRRSFLAGIAAAMVGLCSSLSARLSSTQGDMAPLSMFGWIDDSALAPSIHANE